MRWNQSIVRFQSKYCSTPDGTNVKVTVQSKYCTEAQSMWWPVDKMSREIMESDD
jgi:hypothetical protein